MPCFRILTGCADQLFQNAGQLRSAGSQAVAILQQRRISHALSLIHIYGLSVVKNPQRHKTARSVYFAEKNGEPTRYNLMRRALDEALTISSKMCIRDRP